MYVEREYSSHSVPVSHGLKFTQSAVRPELAKSRPQSQNSNLNGYVHGHQILQTIQNGSNFLGMDLESHCHNITSRGLSIYESKQGSDPENHTALVRSESCESPISFDFFGSQQQISRQKGRIMQSLPPHQSVFTHRKLLQEQGMLKKRQELQRQEQIQQLEALGRMPLNQIPSITEQTSGSHSPTLISGTPITPTTEASNYPWATQAVNGFRFPLEKGQPLGLMGLVPQQQADQSLYGVPGSTPRASSHQYSHVPPDKSAMRQMTMYSNSFPSNEFTGFSDPVNMQDGSSVSRQLFHGENLFSHASGQGLDGGMNLETMQGKTGNKVSSSHNVAGLDPTEEKILFGDDNIWDAFGSATNMGVGGFMLDGTGFSDGFPTLQSGSWSALMQSAVAETSSNDIGLRGEWNGLISRNTQVAGGNLHPSAYENTIKQQTVCSSESVPLANDANLSDTYQGFPGFQHSGKKFSYEHSERLQRNFTPRSIQQSSEEGSKWLTCGSLQRPVSEGTQIYGNAADSFDAEMNVKSITGSWPHQQKGYSLYSCQQQNKPNLDNVGEAVTASHDALSRHHENDKELQLVHISDDKRMMHEEISHGGHLWKADSAQVSSIGVAHAMSSREDSSLNNLGGIPYASSERFSQETTHLFPNSHHLSYWKPVDSSLKSKGTADSGKFQHHHNKAPQVLESSTNYSDKGAFKRHETVKYDRKENCSDSHSSTLCQYSKTGDIREGIWSDGSESQNFAGCKEKLSGQAGQRIPGNGKFQYHPLGNLDEDVEPSYGMEHATHSRAMSLQIPSASNGCSQEYFGQSNFFGHFPKTSSEMEKDLERKRNEVDDTPSRGTLPGFAPNTSAPLDTSVSIHEPNKATESSQNMLELLHKVDESQEHRNSDGSFSPLWQNQSSSSQGFSLQLAPPSQRLQIHNHALTSHGKPTNSSQSLFRTPPEMSEKGRTWLASEAQLQSLPFPLETSQREFKLSGIGMPGQTGITETHKVSQNILQPIQSSINMLSKSPTPLDQEDQVLQKGVNCPSEYGINSAELQDFVLQPGKESLHQLVYSGNTELVERMTASQGKEYGGKNQPDSSCSNSPSTQRDIEAFGRFLKPNSPSHQNYSFLQQVQAMKCTEVDPSNRSLKRLKTADSGLGSGDSIPLAFLGDRNAASLLGNNGPSQDVLPLGRKDFDDSHSYSAASVEAEHSGISPQMAPSWFNQFGTFKNGQILPMYASQKNGAVNTAEQRFAFGKSSDNLLQSQSLEQVNGAADLNQVGKTWRRSTPTSEAIEHFSSSRPLVQDLTDQSVIVLRPKKRKSATSELLAWHKEVMQGSKSLLAISLAEVDWAKAAKQLIDKVEVEPEIFEDGQPMLSPKRRLILTTQLMQQLFLPPPAAVSADVSSNFETVAYFVARRALGGACSLIPFSGSNSCVPLDSSNLIGDQNLSEVVEDVDKSSGLSDKCKLSERIDDRHLSKVVEAFINSARKLENEFMTLDKRASILDLRIENQEIEKFSVINRFAKFHSQGQADASDTSSSSDTAANAQRPFPQRYVTAVPLPQNLPDRVQCLSI